VKNSGSKKIAERYVAALFDVAAANNSLFMVEKDLLTLADLLKENVDFVDFLHNPLLTRAQKGKITNNLLKQLGAHQTTAQFITLLAASKRLDLLSEMIEIFLKKAVASRGELGAELVVACAISPTEASAIADSLGKAYNKKITLNVREDASLLGGVIINVDSLRLDGSLAGKLNRLKQTLKVA
jgi:F-type H+-transporting ATPase subunit delta